jgi:plasmid stabilization system protein ParE
MAHRFSPQARTDLGRIWDHIVTNGGSEDVANRQIDSITARFYLLTSHPKIGRARDDDPGRDLRRLPIGNYVIVAAAVVGREDAVGWIGAPAAYGNR